MPNTQLRTIAEKIAVSCHCDDHPAKADDISAYIEGTRQRFAHYAAIAAEVSALREIYALDFQDALALYRQGNVEWQQDNPDGIAASLERIADQLATPRNS